MNLVIIINGRGWGNVGGDPNQRNDFFGAGDRKDVRQRFVIEDAVLRVHDEVVPAAGAEDLGDLGGAIAGHHGAEADSALFERLFHAVFFQIHDFTSKKI